MRSGFAFVERKISTYTPCEREWATSLMTNEGGGGGSNEFRDKDSPSIRCQWSSRRADGRVEVRELLVLLMGNNP